MTRLLGPDAGSRTVFLPSGAPAVGRVGTIYTSEAGDTLASIAAYQAGTPATPGALISGSQVTVDAYGLLPRFWFPDGADTVWIVVNNGPITAVNADYDGRLDSLAATATTNSAAIAANTTAIAAETSRATAAEALKATATALTTETSRATAAEALLLPLSGGTVTGDVIARSYTTNATVRSAFFKTTSSTEHAATVYQAGTSGVDVAAALNIVSDNSASSCVYVSGTETNRGTVKIAHHGQSDGSDSGAAAVSIDLQGSGTAAQGIFMTSTNATPSGNWITVRANSRDDFVVKSTGRVGIGLGTGSTPAGRLEVKQTDDTSVGLAMTANSGSALQMILLKDSGGNARFEVNAAGNAVMRATAFFTTNIQLFGTSAAVGGANGVLSINDRGTAPTSNNTGGGILYSEAGALKWRGASGTTTTIAVA